MDISELPFRNILKQKKRSAGLFISALVMAVCLFGGSIFVLSLRRGLTSLNDRLGADIIVLPNDAGSRTELQNILLQGTPGYFYMDKSVVDRLSNIEGVDKLSPQYFLVSANAECCSVKVQIIGFDEETDFTVKPWLKTAYDGTLGKDRLIVGASLSTIPGHTLKLYGNECLVAGKLEKTGTGLDTAVYASNDTVKKLISAAGSKGIGVLSKQDPDDVVSSVYINVKDGYDIDDIVSQINLEHKDVQAIRAKSMMTSTAEKLDTIKGTITLFTVTVSFFAAVFMTVAFAVISHERKREFAVLRVIGLSRRGLFKVIMTESVTLAAAGSAAGIIVTGTAVYAFRSLIESRIDLPYLLPGLSTAVLFVLLSAAIVILTAVFAGGISAYKAVREDTGILLREG